MDITFMNIEYRILLDSYHFAVLHGHSNRGYGGQFSHKQESMLEKFLKSYKEYEEANKEAVSTADRELVTTKLVADW
jgi:hypothetical protein